MRKFLVIPIVVIYFLFTPEQTVAQFKSAMVGVNGLTCSACTRAVEKSIRKLSFVKDVQMNLEHTDGKIIFNDNSDVDISKICKAVTDAGFSVRYLSAAYIFKDVTVTSGFCLNSGKYNFQFVNTAERKLNGESQIKFLGQEFLPKGEFNKTKSLLVNSCSDKNEKVYFVTL